MTEPEFDIYDYKQIAQAQRDLIFEMGMFLLAVPFGQRDDNWEKAIHDVKVSLNQTRQHLKGYGR